jgi:hypothetical protein
MSERDHIISNPSDSQRGGLGKRYPENYRSAYPASPIHDGTMVDNEVIRTFIPAVQNGEATAGFTAYGSTVNGGVGNRMSSYNRDYPDAPDIASNNITYDGKVFGSGEGAPSNPYVPPLTSPGPGLMSATDQPAYTGNLPIAGGEFGSGLGSTANPSVTSPEIATQDVDTATALISGRSYAGSAG